VRYALLAPPLTQTQDADGDGFEEVFIEQRTAGQNPCLLVYRVRDVGYVDRLNTSLRAFGREHCSSGVADVDQDGKAELLVDIEFVEFELPTAPTLRLLLWPERHSYSARGTGEQLARFIAAQQAARELDLESARADEDTATALRLAVELAALTQALGLPSQDQLARFDSALRDFALSPAEQSRAQTARQQIEQAWKEAPKLSGPEPAQRDASEAGPPSTGLAERHAS
jgi:hypothetical protein